MNLRGLPAGQIGIFLRLPGFIFQAEQFQQVQVQAVLHAPTGFLAGDDVAEIGDGEDVFLHGSGFGFGEAFDAIGCEDQIEVEGAVFELREIFAPDDLGLGVVTKEESDGEQGMDDPLAVFY